MRKKSVCRCQPEQPRLAPKKFVRGCSGMVLPEYPVRGMRGGT